MSERRIRASKLELRGTKPYIDRKLKRLRAVMSSVKGSRLTRKGETGASLVEYVLLVALLILVCIPATSFLGRKIDTTLVSTGDAIAGACNGDGLSCEDRD